MRSGPKFEITFDMAVSNVRTVAARLQVGRLSLRQYKQHGSFCGDTLCRKFGWMRLAAAAGIQAGEHKRPVSPRRLCSQDCGRQSMTYPRWHLCRTCARRVRRTEMSAVELYQD